MLHKKITILVVDDFALIRDAWKTLLERNGFEVIAAVGEGQRAIDYARDKRPHLILLDINMTPVNGFDVLKETRRVSPGTKVIAVSGHPHSSYVKQMIKGGAKGYITKNTPADEFIEIINRVMEGEEKVVCQDATNIMNNEIFDSTEEEIRKGYNALSQREIEVIRCIVEGLNSKQIADKLNRSIKTVEVHRHNVLKKMKMKNTASLIKYITEKGNLMM
jgi:two-component system invasion response regulator UvrY